MEDDLIVREGRLSQGDVFRWQSLEVRILQKQLQGHVENIRLLHKALACKECPIFSSRIPKGCNISTQDTELRTARLQLRSAMQRYPVHASLMTAEAIDTELIDTALSDENLDCGVGVMQDSMRALKVDGGEGARYQLAPPNSEMTVTRSQMGLTRLDW